MNQLGAPHVGPSMTNNSPTHRIATGLLIAALALFGAACGNDEDDETAGSQSQTTAASVTTLAVTTTVAPNTVSFKDFAFVGIDNTRANATWNITNSDTVPHTVTAVDGSFVWRVEAGQTTPFPKTLTPGSYPIRCDIHPTRMTGTLVVR